MQYVARHLRTFTMIAFVATWALRLATSGVLWTDDRAHYVPSSPTADAAVTPGHLLEAHDCWRHQAPADMRGKLPGHVVVTTRSGRVVYGGTRLVGKALDQEFAHQPAGLAVWGFCR